MEAGWGARLALGPATTCSSLAGPVEREGGGGGDPQSAGPTARPHHTQLTGGGAGLGVPSGVPSLRVSPCSDQLKLSFPKLRPSDPRARQIATTRTAPHLALAIPFVSGVSREARPGG